MHIQLRNQPGNTAACITLRAGDQLTAQAGAMLAMSPTVDLSTSTHKRNSGSFLKAAKRLLAGESIFLNHYSLDPSAGVSSGEVWLGTGLAGDMLTLNLDGDNLVVQAGSYLASSSGIDIDMGWQGFKSLFSGEAVFWLKLGGQGQVILSSFGAIYPLVVTDEVIVDSGHIVAFSETLDFSISKAGSSWLHSLLGGEGLVCRFRGQGTVWCQSHQAKRFGLALSPNLKPRKA